jgi:hypothetical protein
MRTYSAKQVSVSFFGYELTGLADGDDVILVEPNVEQSEIVTGNDGTTTRSINPDESGTITIKLKQSSPSNDTLSGLAAKDKVDGSVVGACIVKDNSGTSVAMGSEAVIAKTPGQGYGATASDRTWIIKCGKLFDYAGSNNAS